jgi:hypothetical protein
MPRGGKRPNSGPKKGTTYQPTIDKAAARQALRSVVLRHMDAMLEAQIKNAQGIKYLVKRAKAGGKFEKVSADQLEDVLAGQDDGSLMLEVWEERPNVQAFTDLMNRALDKPSEHLELTGADGTPLVVQWKGK